MQRRRVSLVESYRAATKAALKSSGPDDGLLFANLWFGFWWWIVGLPEDAPDIPEDQPPPA